VDFGRIFFLEKMGWASSLREFFTCPEFRISTSGCWIFFLSVGAVRGLTVVQEALIHFFQADATAIMSFSSMLLAGYAIGGLASGYIIPKCGVRWPTVFAGFSCCAGFCICAAVMHYEHAIPLIAAILFVLVGLPQGVAINAVLGSAKSHVRSNMMGLVMTLVGGGISLASLILPLTFTEFCKAVGNCADVGDNYGDQVKGLQELFYFLAGIMLIMVVSGLLLIEKTYVKDAKVSSQVESDSRGPLVEEEPSKNPEDQVEEASFWSWELTTTPSFVLHLTGQFVFFSSYFCMFPLAADMLSSIGFGREIDIPLLLLILGIVEFCARMIYAFFLADRFNKITLMGLTYLGDGLGFLILMAAYQCRVHDIDPIMTTTTAAPIVQSGARPLMQNVSADALPSLVNMSSSQWIQSQEGDYEIFHQTVMADSINFGEDAAQMNRLRWALTILAFAIGGFFNAGFGGLLNAVVVEIVNPKIYATAVGMQALIIGIGETVGPFIGGAIADASVPKWCEYVDWRSLSSPNSIQSSQLDMHSVFGENGATAPWAEWEDEIMPVIEQGIPMLERTCEKAYWHCFVAGSVGMVLSALITALMKFCWTKEENSRGKKEESGSDPLLAKLSVSI